MFCGEYEADITVPGESPEIIYAFDGGCIYNKVNFENRSKFCSILGASWTRLWQCRTFSSALAYFGFLGVDGDGFLH